jgi:hypothetical protein
MATDEQMNELMGRMIRDADFRKDLMADPKSAAEKAGYDLSGEQLAELQAAETGELIGAVDERVSKRAMHGR